MNIIESDLKRHSSLYSYNRNLQNNINNYKFMVTDNEAILQYISFNNNHFSP
jgi:hypothetical protein